LTLSFIIPAYNEASLIGATIRSIDTAASANGVTYEIIVADDASTDETAAVARAADASVVSARCRQIAAARNAGARQAQGDALVFVDADTTIDARVVRDVVEALRAGAVGGGARVRFDEPIPAYARISLLLFFGIAARLRIASGCFLFCTREAFDAVGGFDERFYAAEEVFLSRTLRRLGRIVIVKSPVVTSGRKLRSHSGKEILVAGLGLVRGLRGTPDRQRLDLWYGPRRDDLQSASSPTAPRRGK
jgi:glycosyltransferase involved in cell wall biosynthesis